MNSSIVIWFEFAIYFFRKYRRKYLENSHAKTIFIFANIETVELKICDFHVICILEQFTLFKQHFKRGRGFYTIFIYPFFYKQLNSIMKLHYTSTRYMLFIWCCSSRHKWLLHNSFVVCDVNNVKIHCSSISVISKVHQRLYISSSVNVCSVKSETIYISFWYLHIILHV